MRISTFINVHKVLVTPVVLAFMWYFHNWSTEAFIYLALHGTYTVLWIIKHYLFGDKRFDEKQPFWIGLIFIFIPLAGYYVAPYLLISMHTVLQPYMLGIILFVYIMGTFLHYVSDAQKYYTLQLQKGLITEGLFSRTRNPNYLGEIMIYSAYAMMAMHWLPWVILGGWVFGFFVRNMLSKDKSLSRYAEFKEYKTKSSLLLPKL